MHCLINKGIYKGSIFFREEAEESSTLRKLTMKISIAYKHGQSGDNETAICFASQRLFTVLLIGVNGGAETPPYSHGILLHGTRCHSLILITIHQAARYLAHELTNAKGLTCWEPERGL